MPMFGSAPTPPAPPPIPPAANPATAASGNVTATGQQNKQRQAAIGEMANGTNPTGGRGLSAPQTAKTTLLGD